jgi:hypothetical protein
LRAGAAALALSLATASAAADNPHELGDLSIEQVMDLRIDKVYSASKYEQKVTRAPASVTIVTADEIRKSGYRTLADVLRSVAGVYVTNNRNYSFVGFRGFSQPGDFNTGILLLIDGHRVNDAIYNLSYVAQEALVDVDMIERVEIIRGPGSSIYGNSAFFCVIDIITRSGAAIGGEEPQPAAQSNLLVLRTSARSWTRVRLAKGPAGERRQPVARLCCSQRRCSWRVPSGPARAGPRKPRRSPRSKPPSFTTSPNMSSSRRRACPSPTARSSWVHIAPKPLSSCWQTSSATAASTATGLRSGC